MTKLFLLKLPEDVHRDIKVHAAEMGLTMQEFFNMMVRLYLDNKKEKK